MTYETKQNLTSIGFAIGCLALYFQFPVGDLKMHIFCGIIVFLGVLPYLYTKIIIKQEKSVLGLVSWKNGDIYTLFFLASAVIVGGLVGFCVVSLGWGVENYLAVISETILYDFRAFLIYEIAFVAPMIFLITFFSWGFVYAIKWSKEIYTFICALIAYSILLYSFYNSFWIITPFLIPAFFVPKIRDGKNVTYMAIVVFFISLIIDTLIVKLV